MMHAWPPIQRRKPHPQPPVVISISPMAHFAVGFFALGLLVPVLTWR